MPESPVLLAADVGGTNTRMARFALEGGRLRELETVVVSSHSEESLEQILASFLARSGGPPPDAAALAIAGPVVDQAVDVTNLGWRVEAEALGRALGIERLRLLNDLEATALGMLELPEDRFAVLQEGSRPPGIGHVVVVAAGTGLGLATLVWDGVAHHPVATESGHAGYAPRDEQDLALWRTLRARHGRVSVERVVSGPGLADRYTELRAASGRPESPELAERLAGEDPSAVVAELGLEDHDPVCREALERFVADYGAVAGDAALQHLALGGVRLGGGIAPKILRALRGPGFLAAFLDKGRFAALLSSLRVSVCLAPNPALEGAARLAARSLSVAGGTTSGG